MLSFPGLQARLGRKFTGETELLPLLALAHGLIRRVRTTQNQARPLGGYDFDVTLEAPKPTVGEAKAEIIRLQGAPGACLELLYKVAERADGLAVREDETGPGPPEHGAQGSVASAGWPCFCFFSEGRNLHFI
jgi:hypothetical protein